MCFTLSRMFPRAADGGANQFFGKSELDHFGANVFETHRGNLHQPKEGAGVKQQVHYSSPLNAAMISGGNGSKKSLGTMKSG